MLHVYVMQLGDYQTNCYVAWQTDSKTCVVIDPGNDVEQIYEGLGIFDLKVGSILLTHGHFDHVGAVKELVAKTGCPVYMHKADYQMENRVMYPLAGEAFENLVFLEDGDTLSLSGLDIQVFHTPGHTPGSVCFLIENSLITGDTLFAGSCGRTDLPGGDWDTICRSLHKLSGMNKKYKVYPGHGEYSTIENELKSNPFLKGML